MKTCTQRLGQCVAALFLGLLSLLILGVLPEAHAGQNCEARKLSASELRQSLELAANTVRYLEQGGARAAIIARAGQNLSEYQLHYSHLGIAYRDESALGGRGAWRVVHKLNQCGSDRGELYRQGLGEFFGDTLYRYEAGIVILRPDVQESVQRALHNDALINRLHQPRYNMLAYPWASLYQQSNQWVIETLAMIVEPSINSRLQDKIWLRQNDYQPSTLHISPLKRLGARIGTAHIAFDDHPTARRIAGQIDTVTVDSVFRWLERRQLGLRVETIRADTPPRPRPPPAINAPIITHAT
jgi:hypothetical protein